MDTDRLREIIVASSDSIVTKLCIEDLEEQVTQAIKTLSFACTEATGNLTRSDAADAIGRLMSLFDECVIPALREATDDADFLVRTSAIQALCEIGVTDIGAEETEQAAMALFKNDKDPLVRISAAMALGRLNCQESIPLLEKRIRRISKTNYERYYIAHALTLLGLEKYWEVFLSGLEDEPFRHFVAVTMDAVVNSDNAEEALVALKKALKLDKHESTKREIQTTIDEITEKFGLSKGAKPKAKRSAR